MLTVLAIAAIVLSVFALWTASNCAEEVKSLELLYEESDAKKQMSSIKENQSKLLDRLEQAELKIVSVEKRQDTILEQLERGRKPKPGKS